MNPIVTIRTSYTTRIAAYKRFIQQDEQEIKHYQKILQNMVVSAEEIKLATTSIQELQVQVDINKAKLGVVEELLLELNRFQLTSTHLMSFHPCGVIL